MPSSGVSPRVAAVSDPGGAVVSLLARLRVSLGFVFGALVLWLAQPTKESLMLGGLFAVLGEALRIWAAGHLNKSREVTTSGPYRWVAHPLYVGSAIMGAGLAIASANGVAAVLVAIYLGTAVIAAVRSEEAFLHRAFGERYGRYRGSGAGETGSSDARRRFSAARAVANREHRAAIGLLVAVLLLLLKATYNGALDVSFWPAAGTRLGQAGRLAQW
jgi:protein-S-isoprenylcysteine O-methyltransferase Ste14